MIGRRYSVAFVAIGIVLAIAFATIAMRFLPSMNDHAALADEPVVIGATPPRLARRVVLVIIDGLRLDTSRGLPFLDRLRAAGVDGEAVAPWPTLSLPNYVTILAGVEPRWSGVRNNQWSGHLDLDSLPARLSAAGLRTGFATDQRRAITLFGTTWERRLPSTVSARSEDLLVLVPAAVDVAGHAAGANSDDYRAAARDVDRQIASMLDVDLARDAIVIVADHGHTARGGHGGTGHDVTSVPLVLAGAGIRRGAIVRDARLTDIAPTIAALLGLPAPAHATGRALIDALAIDDPSSVLSVDVERRARLAAVLAAIEAREHAAITTARAWRIPCGALVIVFLIALLVRAVRRGAVIIDHRVLVASIVFPVVFYVAVPSLPLGLLPAHSPGDAFSLALELAGYVAVASVAQLVAMAVAARGSAERGAGIFTVGLLVTALPAIATWALLGEPFATTLPSPALFMLTPITAAAAAVQAGLGAIVLAAILIRTRGRETRDMVAPS